MLLLLPECKAGLHKDCPGFLGAAPFTVCECACHPLEEPNGVGFWTCAECGRLVPTEGVEDHDQEHQS